MWDDLEATGTLNHIELFGEVTIYDGYLTRQLLLDVESLLIMRMQTRSNMMGKKSRISRPGLCVECTGHRSMGPNIYVDD